jgi:hypothetical protein
VKASGAHRLADGGALVVRTRAGLCIVVTALALSAITVACQRPCDFARDNCRIGQACAFVAPGKPPECVETSELDVELMPPFTPGQEFWCSQAGRSSAGRTHSFQHDLFALDLASQSPDPVAIVAPVAGEATVFDDCDDERDSSSIANNDSDCGAGYGNHIRIWDGHRIFLLAHLARIDIHNGPVERGQRVGLMGCSGRAGHRHVHFAITTLGKHDNRATILASPAATGSIPVRAKILARRPDDEIGTPLWQDLFECSPTAATALPFVR